MRKRPRKDMPEIKHGDIYDISKSPKDSINHRFHVLGFKKHYECDGKYPTHVYTRGEEVYRFRNIDATIEKLLELGLITLKDS